MKKLFIMLVAIASIVCMFAITSSAKTELKPQDNNQYGELSFFDESISVGRTNTSNGFSPYIDAEGTTYARVVVGDGTTFYTFPTAYIISNGAIYGGSGKSIYAMDMSSLNSAMATATGKNPGWNHTNIYRLEIAYNTTYFNGGSSQFFQSYENMIELRLQPNSATWDANKQMLAFWNCYDLETIHNLDTFTFKDGTLGGAFQNCRSLTSLTIGVSPDVKTTQDSTFNGCTALKSLNFKEAFPNLTTIGSTVFSGCANLKYLSIPASVTTFKSTAFQNFTGLTFVDFNDNQNVFNEDTWGLFQGCTSLRAVSLPDNFKYIPNRMFAGCTSLKAVYLPKNLERMDTNNWGEDPFNGCTNVYFVHEPFEVVDENGNFYTAETFKQPAKPDVYYMPESLSQLCTNKTSGKCFTKCYNLNPVIVFGTNMRKTTVGDGIFFECGSNGTLGDGVTAVFLGDMEQICINTNENRAKGVKYIFANENDKSLADVNIINNTTNSYNLNDKTEGFYFCHGNCHYLLYNGTKNVQYNGTYSDSVLTKVEGALHLVDVNNSELISPATCVAYAEYQASCFCGHEMGKTYGTSYDLTNHNYDTANGATIVSISYNKIYTANGTKVIACGRDGCEEHTSVIVAPLFVAKGYSIKETGYGLISTYIIDVDALNEYEKVNGAITIGIIMANANFEGKETIMTKDGDKYLLNSTLGIQLEVTQRTYSKINATIDQFTENEAGLNLVMALYVVDKGELTFVQSEGDYLDPVAKNDGALDVITISYIANLKGFTLPFLPAPEPTTGDEEQI